MRNRLDPETFFLALFYSVRVNNGDLEYYSIESFVEGLVETTRFLNQSGVTLPWDEISLGSYVPFGEKISNQGWLPHDSPRQYPKMSPEAASTYLWDTVTDNNLYTLFPRVAEIFAKLLREEEAAYA